MRRSAPTPSTTSAMSAPTTAHILASSLANVILAARNTFEPTLIISAPVRWVTWMGASRGAYRFDSAAASGGGIEGSSTPMTIRSGTRKSLTAFASRVNSGFTAISTSGATDRTSVASFTAVPGISVLRTTSHLGARGWLARSTTARRTPRSVHSPRGSSVPTAMIAMREPLMLSMSSSNDRRFVERPASTRSSKPGSWKGSTPRRSRSTLSRSTSRTRTWLPR